MKTCDLCGNDAPRKERCTNGRCRTCHTRICGPGGNVDQGHGKAAHVWPSPDGWSVEVLGEFKGELPTRQDAIDLAAGLLAKTRAKNARRRWYAQG